MQICAFELIKNIEYSVFNDSQILNAHKNVNSMKKNDMLLYFISYLLTNNGFYGNYVTFSM